MDSGENEIPVRYNSGIQRSKGLLELAAALYDTSLARYSTRSGTTIRQIDSRLGTKVKLSIEVMRPAPSNPGVNLSFGVGGSRDNLIEVAEKRLSLLWINPNAPLALAYKGCAPFSKSLPLRTVAVFPSWDAVVLAVHESTGITSVDDFARRRPALRLSTGGPLEPPFGNDPTMFTVDAMLSAAGFSLQDVRNWGGTIHSSTRPSHPDRARMIAAGELDAIFDEGILSWGQFALERGFRILSLEGAIRDRMVACGFDIIEVAPRRIPALQGPVNAVDFSGWPMIVHADMEDEVAYALCEAIETRKLAIPTDNFKPLDLAQLCTPDEETPRGAPLHPGAERFYRERGYLRG